MAKIGEQISPTLELIEMHLWSWEVQDGNGKPDYTKGGFRAAVKIFISAIMDKIWELQEDEKISMDDRERMVQKCGEDLQKLIKTYTDIDTKDLYKEGL